MSRPEAILSLVTLGVADVGRSIAFYETLGFRRKAKAEQGVGFFQAGAASFAVWSLDSLIEDAGVPANAPTGFGGIALGWNCRSEAEVDTALELARKAGGTVRKAGQKTFWGGYTGYFADPDGHLWEVAHNPGFPLTEDGRLTLPD